METKLEPGSGLVVSDALGRKTSGTWRTVVQVVWVLGLIGSVSFVGWQHRRLAKWVGRQERLTNPVIRSLLERCQELAGVSRHIGLVVSEPLSVPTLWGWRKPVLLLPASCLRSLSEPELSMVLLHELAHVRRRDILLNWLMIWARSIHWFNPLVWVALRRLRADREMVCDEMVLRWLSPPERTLYGKTLLRLLETASGGSFHPTLVPIVSNKHEIKRRITMISEFKPVSRLSVLAVAPVFVLLGWIAFTRAADSPPIKVEHPSPTSPLLPETVSPAVKAGDRGGDLSSLRKRLSEVESRIAQQQARVDGLRVELARTSAGETDLIVDAETIRMLERERITALVCTDN